MDRHVPLEGFPDGLAFPESLAGRFRHDAASRRLIYRGFMSKAEFDRLFQLHPSWAYRRALGDLFRLCVEAKAPAPSGLARLLHPFRRS